MPIGDGAEAEAEGGAIGYVAENGHMDARTWHVGELWNAASGATLHLPQAYFPPGREGTPVSMQCY